MVNQLHRNVKNEENEYLVSVWNAQPLLQKWKMEKKIEKRTTSEYFCNSEIPNVLIINSLKKLLVVLQSIRISLCCFLPEIHLNKSSKEGAGGESRN